MTRIEFEPHVNKTNSMAFAHIDEPAHTLHFWFSYMYGVAQISFAFLCPIFTFQTQG